MSFSQLNAPVIVKTAKLAVTTDAQSIDPKGLQAIVYVNSGAVYITGEYFTANTNDFPLYAGSSISFSNKISVVSDSSADLRVMYYDFL